MNFAFRLAELADKGNIFDPNAGEAGKRSIVVIVAVSIFAVLGIVLALLLCIFCRRRKLGDADSEVHHDEEHRHTVAAERSAESLNGSSTSRFAEDSDATVPTLFFEENFPS